MNLTLEVDGFDSVTYMELGLPKTFKLNIQQIYKFYFDKPETTTKTAHKATPKEFYHRRKS